MSLLPAPRDPRDDRSGGDAEPLEVAELHALAGHAPGSPAERAEGLLRVARLAALRQLPQRAGRVLDDVDRELAAAPADPPLRRAADAERLWLDITLRRGVADVERALARGTAMLDACGDGELATRARLLFCVGYCASWLGEPALLSRASDWLSEAVGLYRVLVEPELQAEALLALGYMVFSAQRLYSRAITALSRSSSLLPTTSVARGVHLAYLAESRVIVGDLDAAERELREAHSLGARHGDERLIGYAAWELARIADLRGDARGCDAWIAEARRHPGEWLERAPGSEFIADTVLWAFRQGRLELARERCSALEARSVTEGQDLGARGLVVLLESEQGAPGTHASPAEAARLIGRHLELGWQEPRLWHWRILLADALRQAGDAGQSARLAEEVDEELRRLGLPHLAAHVEPERWGRVSAGLRAAAATRLLAFTRPRIEDGGVVREIPHGIPAALAALLVASGRPLSIDEVCDELWPGVAPDLSRQRLRNVVRRVRAAATSEVIERVGDALRLSPAVITDGTEFERAARSAADAEAPDAEELRAVLAAYGDGFAPGAPGERVEAHRRRYARLAADVRRALIESLIARGDRDAAADEATRALADDPFDDEIAVRIARAYAAAGDGARARAWEERARLIEADLAR